MITRIGVKKVGFLFERFLINVRLDLNISCG